MTTTASPDSTATLPAAAAAAPRPAAARQPLAPSRDQSIETLRGLAIVLMVLGHIIGNTAAGGLRVADDSFLRYVYYAQSFLPMPLFAAIAGYVYAMRPATETPAGRFFKSKACRLLLPMATVGTLQYLTRVVAPDINNPAELQDIWRIYLFGFDQFWFLQALMLLFAAVFVLDRARCMQTPGRWAAVLAASFVICFAAPRVALFSASGAVTLLPAFILGVGLYRFHDRLTGRPLTIAAWAAFLTTIALQQLTWFRPDILAPVGYTELALSVAVGVTGSLALILLHPTAVPLAWLGAYAYTIYLFHVFGTAPTRIALRKIGIDDATTILLVSLAAGLLLPVVAQQVLRHIPPLRLLFLGEKPRKKAPAHPAAG